MNRLRTRLALVLSVCTTAVFLSCDARKEVTASEPGVWLMPRFTAGTTVPVETRTVEGRLSAKGKPDTVLTVQYQSGEVIEFGTLPPQTPFRLTLTGFDSLGKALWWSYADDTTSSSPVKDVLLSLAPVPSAAGSLLPTNSVWYKGDTLPVPAGAVYTVDGSDPRTSDKALTVLGTSGLLVDSNNTIKVAVRVPGDSVTGRPELWSPVETYAFTIDALDTLTTLDTLWMRWEDRGSSATFLFPSPGQFQPEISTYTAPLNYLFDTTVALFLKIQPRSPRCTILVEGNPTGPTRSMQVLLPSDSTFDVEIRNHGHRRRYSVRLTRGNSLRPVIAKVLDSLFLEDTLRKETEPASGIFDLPLPAGDNRVHLRAVPRPGTRVVLGDSILASGESVEIEVGQDTSTVDVLVVDSLGDPEPKLYKVRIKRPPPSSIAFRDTTWGVPWRDVPYDTLVDSRNGRKYRTVMVGNARWMAENLNFRRDSSFCPAMTDSCAKNGRWYRWAAAADTTPAFDSMGLATTTPLKGICPSGWHLPSETEWRNLIDHLGTSKSATLLRSVGSSWNQAGGEDSVGFRALPGGYRYPATGYPGFFNTRGQTSDAYFWTSTQSSLDATRAGSVHISGSAPAVDFVANSPKSDALSVRCVEDAAP